MSAKRFERKALPARPRSPEHVAEYQHRLDAYLAAGLTESERTELEEHLADCPACRHRLVALRIEHQEAAMVAAPSAEARARALALGGEPSQTRRIGLLAAGLAMVVLGGGLWLRTSGPARISETNPDLPGSVLRLEDVAMTLELSSPVDGAVLELGPVEMQWTPVVDVVSYRLIILDAAGVPFEEHRTEDPRWVWQGRLGVAFWYVEAELTDGTRIESEPHQFEMR